MFGGRFRGVESLRLGFSRFGRRRYRSYGRSSVFRAWVGFGVRLVVNSGDSFFFVGFGVFGAGRVFFRERAFAFFFGVRVCVFGLYRGS